MTKRVVCPYCNKPALLYTGLEVYPHRKDLHKKFFWQCTACDARVGCHGNTTTPYGSLANAALRAKRSAAHAAFDPLWRSEVMGRKEAYAWLASKLHIPVKECHISQFQEITCDLTIQICNEVQTTGEL